MKQLLIPKEYKELLEEKAHIEEELRWFLVKKLPVIGHLGALKDLAKLRLNGGPRNLSSKLDNYLYA
ncbi:MAG: hypothetical protein Q7K26_03015 [bacterium]|nr:hypothetical protein [bacterium]